MKKYFLIIVPIYALMLLMSRHPLITDDVSETNRCLELEQKSDVIFVIPPYSEELCNEMALTDKMYGMHGITHSYHEFLEPVDEDVLNETITSYKKCFRKNEWTFRPPQNRISKENAKIVNRYEIEIYKTPYILHPYCHCNPKSYMRILNALILC
ncbi:MAG: hypothetical protein V1906_02180 [Candidatus Woesearchaeota archaeon]